MNKYVHYPEPEFVSLLTRLSVGDVVAIEPLAKWLDENHPEDGRQELIRNIPTGFNTHRALATLHLFDCQPCTLCRG